MAGGGATGAVLGWNALHACAVLLGGYGCFKLSQRLFGGHPALPWIGAVMAAVFCANTYLMNWPYMGRTEALPAVLYPLHLSLLHSNPQVRSCKSRRSAGACLRAGYE